MNEFVYLVQTVKIVLLIYAEKSVCLICRSFFVAFLQSLRQIFKLHGVCVRTFITTRGSPLFRYLTPPPLSQMFTAKSNLDSIQGIEPYPLSSQVDLNQCLEPETKVTISERGHICYLLRRILVV